MSTNAIRFAGTFRNLTIETPLGEYPLIGKDPSYSYIWQPGDLSDFDLRGLVIRAEHSNNTGVDVVVDNTSVISRCRSSDLRKTKGRALHKATLEITGDDPANVAASDKIFKDFFEQNGIWFDYEA
jgi:hypothetical protein